jgi:PBSX family phage portal protein
MTTEIMSDKDQPAKGEAFTFGEPVPVMDRGGLMDYLECVQLSNWYETPISMAGLAKSFRSAPHHESAIHFKANVISSCFQPNKLLSRQDFRRLILDYLVMGNGYLEERLNLRRRAKSFKPALARYTRSGIDLESFWFIQGWSNPFEFENPVHHIMEADINQDIYGVPQYLASLNSAWLNESATLFRRKYYENGSHAGFILYVNDTAQSQGDIDQMRTSLKESKGVGNFKNLFLYAPNGKKDGIQVIPISEVAAKDEMFNIKNCTRDDILASHRTPPALMGMQANNNSGFGALKPIAQIFARNELQPFMSSIEGLNEMTGYELIKFDPYVIEELEDKAL